MAADNYIRFAQILRTGIRIFITYAIHPGCFSRCNSGRGILNNSANFR